MTIWVRRLLLANVAVYMVTALAGPQMSRAVLHWFALVPLAVFVRPWTVFTYMFLHAGMWHLLVNMVGLFFFGPRLEQRLGSRDFLLLYTLSGLGGAVFSFIFAPTAAVVGASGAVFGVLLGFALFWPDEPIYLWAVLPIPAKWLVGGLVILSVYSGIAGAQAGIAHFAHLGGFAGGYGFLKWRERRRRAFGTREPGRPNPLQRLADEVRHDAQRWESISRDDLHEINRAEVDRLLDKIRERGISSLTADERSFLNRMAQR